MRETSPHRAAGAVGNTSARCRGTPRKAFSGSSSKDIPTVLGNKLEMTFDQVRAGFKALDKDGNGELDREEMRHAVDRFNIPVSKAQLETLMGHFDTDGSGLVSYDEFTGGMQKLMEKQFQHTQRKKRSANDMFLITGDPFAAGKLPEVQQQVLGDTMARLRTDLPRARAMGFDAPDAQLFDNDRKEDHAHILREVSRWAGPEAAATPAQRGSSLLKGREVQRNQRRTALQKMQDMSQGQYNINRGSLRAQRLAVETLGGTAAMLGGTTSWPGGPRSRVLTPSQTGGLNMVCLAQQQPRGCHRPTYEEAGGSKFRAPPTPSRTVKLSGTDELGNGIMQYISKPSDSISSYHGLSVEDSATFCNKNPLDSWNYNVPRLANGHSAAWKTMDGF